MDGIVIENVSKRYKDVELFDNISVKFNPGEIAGIIGPNGSGKTVFLKMICGFSRPDSGCIKVYDKIIGKDVDFPEGAGIMLETPGFIPYRTGYGNLKNLADIRRKITKTEICDAIRQVGLDSKSKKLVGKYSLGMRQRLGIAQAIMEDPKLLILDELTNSLDADGVKIIRDLLIKQKQLGKTIIITSHNREDIEALCDKVFKIENKNLNPVVLRVSANNIDK